MRNIKHDLWETRPDLAEHLLDAEDGHRYSQFSNVKVNFVCSSCGYIFNKRLDHASSIGLSCPMCSDNISYPNKVMRYVLNQLGLDFTPEYMFDDYRYQYDFYVPEINTIVEMHGLQHYQDCKHFKKTVQEEQENDKIKEDIALSFGIKNYIVIDCRYSNIDFISKKHFMFKIFYVL